MVNSLSIIPAVCKTPANKGNGRIISTAFVSLKLLNAQSVYKDEDGHVLKDSFTCVLVPRGTLIQVFLAALLPPAHGDH